MSNTSFDSEELVTIDEILQLPPLRNIERATFNRLRRKGLFPYVVLGHKTYLYNPSAVLAALKSLEHPKKES
jgi:hypothetical protein